MPAWATVAITLGAAAIAVTGTLLATGVQLRHARRERERGEAARRRERAGEILGRVRTLLADLDADRIAFNVSDATPGEVQRMTQRWESLRDELSVLAASDADPRVTNAASKLEIAVSKTLNRVGWLVGDMLRRDQDWRGASRQATWERIRALTLTRIVLDLVRGRDVAELWAAIERANATEKLEARAAELNAQVRERAEKLSAGGDTRATSPAETSRDDAAAAGSADT